MDLTEVGTLQERGRVEYAPYQGLEFGLKSRGMMNAIVPIAWLGNGLYRQKM